MGANLPMETGSRDVRWVASGYGVSISSTDGGFPPKNINRASPRRLLINFGSLAIPPYPPACGPSGPDDGEIPPKCRIAVKRASIRCPDRGQDCRNPRSDASPVRGRRISRFGETSVRTKP
jgi:hypothetical protein